jgi:acyl-CoA synthetase (AMP-forming)/AMP-acid ligase II
MSHWNIASRLHRQAMYFPEKTAICFPIRKSAKEFDYQSLNFSQVEGFAERAAWGLTERGMEEGMKALVFMKPSLYFTPFIFSLFKVGIIPVFIDPGMGRKNLLAAIEHIKPDILIGEPIVHFIRLFFKSSFKSIKYFITTGDLKWGEMISLREILTSEIKGDRILFNALASDPAAILYTSGGTGIPKGVLYTHKIFNAQTDTLQTMFDLNPNDVDLPGFPLFSLFTVAMGMKSAIPAMNPAKPAKADPLALVTNINDHKATFVAGSPAIWERVADYCLDHNIQLPTIKYLVMFGAPVSLEIHRKFEKILPNGTTYTPYGATECLPVACTSGAKILEEKITKEMESGKGTYLGPAAPLTEIKIIPINDDVMTSPEFLEKGELGEIAVCSDTVTPEYVGMPDKTSLAKMTDDKGRLWHRMGDLGYLDENDDLWFCGRKSHRISHKEKLYSTIPTEAIFNNHPQIKRTALIDAGDKLGLVIETNVAASKDVLKKEVLELKDKFDHTKEISDIYFIKSMPVDIRHNIKIDRTKLGKLAREGRL